MSLKATFDLDRSIRLAVGRAATIRVGSQAPIDTVIEDISLSGCLIRSDIDMAVGQPISVGIPGIGVHRGSVSRVNHPHYGCAFNTPITTAALEIPQSADSLVYGSFPLQVSTDPILSDGTVSDDEKLPLGLRAAVILGLSIALWMPILFAARSIFA